MSKTAPPPRENQALATVLVSEMGDKHLGLAFAMEGDAFGSFWCSSRKLGWAGWLLEVMNDVGCCVFVKLCSTSSICKVVALYHFLR